MAKEYKDESDEGSYLIIRQVETKTGTELN